MADKVARDRFGLGGRMINRLRVLTALTTVALVLAGVQWCWANSITLISSGGGVYDYGLVATTSVTFDANHTITLSGLSGVTGASVIANGLGEFSVSTVTPTSVVFAPASVFASVTLVGPSTFGTLVVDSSVLTTGPVDYSMATANVGTVAGTVQGPVVSAVPEPTSLVLLGTAMLGLVGLARRRLFG